MRNPTSTPIPKIVRKGECHLLDENDTGGVLSLAREHFEDGVEVRLDGANGHHWFFIERGAFDFQSGREHFQLEALDFVFVPQGATCSLTGSEGTGGTLIHGVMAADASDAAPNSLRPQVTRKITAECMEVFESAVWILAASSPLENRLCAVLVQTPSLRGWPLPGQEQIDDMFLILSGRYEFQIGDARVQVEAGDLLWAPRTTFQHFRVVSGSPGELLRISIPGGFDEAVRSYV